MFLISVHRKMPDYLRPPFWGLVLLFDAWSLPMTGKPFHSLKHADRAAQIEAWRSPASSFRGASSNSMDHSQCSVCTLIFIIRIICDVAQTSGFSNESLSADVIVIGSGPGGSVAGTMIAESDKSV